MGSIAGNQRGYLPEEKIWLRSLFAGSLVFYPTDLVSIRVGSRDGSERCARKCQKVLMRYPAATLIICCMR